MDARRAAAWLSYRHSSLLPKYRGAAPINWAIANGERETGVTIMHMDAGLDTGRILLQSSTPIGNEETAADLTPRLAEIGAEILVAALNGIEKGSLAARAQNDEEASLAPLLKREDGLVNWELTAEEISNRLRGFNPFPGCYTIFNRQRLELVAVKVLPAMHAIPELEPGTVSEIGKDGFTVVCGGATRLLVSEVQPEGKRAMSVRDFLNGAKLTIGARFDSR